MISRRRFVTGVGIGAAGAIGSSLIGGRGRENAIWSMLEPELAAQTATAANPIILSSNENPLGPGKVVLDAIQSAFGTGGAAPGRYSNASGGLVDALAKAHNIQPAN